jgi:N-acetylmuramoyl-L-alanine amidase
MRIRNLAALKFPPAIAVCLVIEVLLCGAIEEGAAGQAAFSRPVKTIVLDPGHGGDDPGARGPGGSLEKSISLKLAESMAHTCGGKYRIVLTRTGDQGLGIADRTATANHQNADVFISLHTGGSFIGSAEGINVYYFDFPQPSVHETEPPVPVNPPGIDAAAPIPWDMLQEDHRSGSRELTGHVQRALKERISPATGRTGGLPLLVLEGAAMPAILVEFGYITNPSEEKALNNTTYISATAEAICTGVDNFLHR